MKEGSLYRLSRAVSGEDGQQYTQLVTVFARDLRSAKAVVDREFSEIRNGSTGLRTPYAAEPAWSAEKIPLDEEKVVASVITYATLPGSWSARDVPRSSRSTRASGSRLPSRRTPPPS